MTPRRGIIRAQAQAQEPLHLSLGALHVHQLDAHRFIAPLSPASPVDLPFALGLELLSARSAQALAPNAQQDFSDGIISLQYVLDGSGQVGRTDLLLLRALMHLNRSAKGVACAAGA